MKATLRKATEAEIAEQNELGNYGDEYVIKVGNRKIFTDLGDEIMDLLDGDVKRIEVSSQPFEGSSTFDVENASAGTSYDGFNLKGKNLEAWACFEGMKKLGLTSKKKVYAKLRR